MRNDDKSTEQDFEAKKPREYELYKLWKSLPAILKHSTEDELRVAGLAGYKEKSGLTDEDDWQMKELLNIRSQTDFAKKYNLSVNTLSRWNYRIEEDNDAIEMMGIWTRKLIPNIVMAMYRHAQIKGSPELIRYLFQMSYGYNFKDSQVDDPQKANPFAELNNDELKELTDDLATLAEQRKLREQSHNIKTED